MRNSLQRENSTSRTADLVRGLPEQIELAKVEQAGELSRPKRYKLVNDAEGNTSTVKVDESVNPWWVVSGNT